MTVRTPATPRPALGLVALGVLALAVLVMAWTTAPLVGDLLAEREPAPLPAGPPPAETLASELRLHADRLDGRSLFFVPPRPAPRLVRADPVDLPPPPPAVYAGPPLVGMVSGTALFADGTWLRAGEESRLADLALLALEPPWSARVRWRGVEFTVPLFERRGLLSAGAPAAEPPRREEAETRDRPPDTRGPAPGSLVPPATDPPENAPPADTPPAEPPPSDTPTPDPPPQPPPAPGAPGARQPPGIRS
ncbi:MAG TPA: hypothetical protein VD963_04265 [Phycisphaerales bacterium]|nr:hypothetical protein [Phycisphaerales bacterium]